ncbi:M56 family metallopeptidase [Cryobacterium sp. SO2]|uniref:M56 family metallopeptidase n=1 Tax=Cryobacterium sp. SO2 TaxID=1897060 RepID=UPI00223DC3BA|nr:M56 family metallopeptidase [Cryobacterium sp. SO2]WEO79064.1 M56 family metallopeptidase [Cryobacterium sp. SO2]
MLTTALGLMVLAIVLAWPVPILLAGAAWPPRAPGLALALWQSIALAGGISMIGSLLVFGLIPFGATPVTALVAVAGHVAAGTLPTGATLAGMMALCLAVILAAHLLLNLSATFIRAERQRRRHHTLIGLLSDPLPNDHEGTRVIDHAAPIAYCLPGGTRSATVLSRGLLSLLDAGQLRGVVAHERAHLRQQHHLVLLAFKSWHSALRWFPIANRAENAVALLVEMMADDQARLEVDDRTLAEAIALVGTAHLDEVSGTQSPRAAAGVLDDTSSADLVGPRVNRLLGDVPALGPAARALALSATAVLLLLPLALLVTTR